MKRNFVAIAILLICLPLLAKAQSSDAKSEETLVRQTVESYINKTTQNVLHPDAKIISVDGSGKGFSEFKINKPIKPQKGVITVESQQKISAIDVTTDGASVKVETEFTSDSNVVPRKHIQYISLLKLNGEWKIVSILMPPLRFTELVSK